MSAATTDFVVIGGGSAGLVAVEFEDATYQFYVSE